jgi:hypothetical protein
MASLQPKFRKQWIGLEESEMIEVTIKPMSIASQLRFKETIQRISNALKEEGFEVMALSNLDFVVFLMGLLEESIMDIVRIVIPQAPDNFLELVTNEQMLAIGIDVFEMNYGSVSKNLKSLFPNLPELKPEK